MEGTNAERVVLIGRPGCHLCDDARSIVAEVCAEAGVAWREESLADHPHWAARYSELIPVVLVDGHEHASWRVDPVALRRTLQAP
jgi:hypothetical protein